MTIIFGVKSSIYNATHNFHLIEYQLLERDSDGINFGPFGFKQSPKPI